MFYFNCKTSLSRVTNAYLRKSSFWLKVSFEIDLNYSDQNVNLSIDIDNN